MVKIKAKTKMQDNAASDRGVDQSRTLFIPRGSEHYVRNMSAAHMPVVTLVQETHKELFANANDNNPNDNEAPTKKRRASVVLPHPRRDGISIERQPYDQFICKEDNGVPKP